MCRKPEPATRVVKLMKPILKSMMALGVILAFLSPAMATTINWTNTAGGDGDGVVQFPIRVTRMVVALRDYQVYVKDMLPSCGNTVRLTNLMAGD